MNTVLVGAGYWGKNFIRIMKSSDNVFNLKYIIDTKEELPQYTCYKNISEIGKHIEEIECAIICTPTQTHSEIVEFFLENKIHVLVEKPLTTSKKEAEMLFNIAKNNNVTLLTDHTFLYNSSIKYLKNLIENNELGDILHCSFERTNLGPIRTDVSCLWDLATHDVSIVNALINDNLKHVDAGGFSKNKNGIKDVVNFSLGYDTCFVSILASWLHPEKSRKIKIVGSKKMVIFDDLNVNEPIKIYDKKIEDISSKITNYGSIFSFSIGDVLIPFIELEEPLTQVISDFESRILNNEPKNLLNTEELTINTISILEKVENLIN